MTEPDTKNTYNRGDAIPLWILATRNPEDQHLLTFGVDVDVYWTGDPEDPSYVEMYPREPLEEKDALVFIKEKGPEWDLYLPSIIPARERNKYIYFEPAPRRDLSQTEST